MTQIHTHATLKLTKRLRRLRTSATMRALVRETRLSPDMFMLPLFVCEGEGVRREVPSMPGVFNLSVDEAVREVEAREGRRRPQRAAVRPARPQGRHRIGRLRSGSAGAVGDPRDQARGARRPRRSPTSACASTPTTATAASSIDDEIANDPTRRAARARRGLARGGRRRHRRAVGHDGRPRRRDPRRRSTSAASSTPRSCRTRRSTAPRSTGRSATRPASAPQFGDRRRTRWIRPTSDEALREVEQDIEEGADIVMVKPALPVSRRHHAGEGDVRLSDRRVPRERRVRDAQGGGAQRLDRRAARDARNADRASAAPAPTSSSPTTRATPRGRSASPRYACARWTHGPRMPDRGNRCLLARIRAFA